MALPLRPHEVRDMRGAEVGRIGQYLRQIEPAVFTLEILDGEAADLDRTGRVELIPDVHEAGVQRHRRRLQFERATGLVTLLDRPVLSLFLGGGAEIVGVVVGQADDGQHFAGIHIHHHAGGADRTEGAHRRQQFLTHHGLHAHIDRQPQRRLV